MNLTFGCFILSPVGVLISRPERSAVEWGQGLCWNVWWKVQHVSHCSWRAAALVKHIFTVVWLTWEALVVAWEVDCSWWNVLFALGFFFLFFFPQRSWAVTHSANTADRFFIFLNMGIATCKTHSNVNAVCDYFQWVELLLIPHCGLYYHIVHIMMIIVVNRQSFVLTEGCDWAFSSETGRLMLTAWSLYLQYSNSKQPEKYPVSNLYLQLFKRYRWRNVNSV